MSQNDKELTLVLECFKVQRNTRQGWLRFDRAHHGRRSERQFYRDVDDLIESRELTCMGITNGRKEYQATNGAETRQLIIDGLKLIRNAFPDIKAWETPFFHLVRFGILSDDPEQHKYLLEKLRSFIEQSRISEIEQRLTQLVASDYYFEFLLKMIRDGSTEAEILQWEESSKNIVLEQDEYMRNK